jgi:hypothetical protein
VRECVSRLVDGLPKNGACGAGEPRRAFGVRGEPGDEGCGKARACMFISLVCERWARSRDDAPRGSKPTISNSGPTTLAICFPDSSAHSTPLPAGPPGFRRIGPLYWDGEAVERNRVIAMAAVAEELGEA